MILDFQLQEHERFLFEFNVLFKQFDTDNDGIVTEEQFKALILSMSVIDQVNIEDEIE